MTIATRSISKTHTMTTRSQKHFMKHDKKEKHTIVVKQSHPPPLVLAEFVPIAYRAINEVLELYRDNPNETYLGYLQEAVSLTVRLHNHYLTQSNKNITI